ncbi:oxygen-dependent coproporphyrinogen oxidase [Sediminibacterium soli]|uniref:oxygen-dependent coproporphyrinogen oxidase n=1 Tax=Sediminibacterium soli TaxID=2698829 RepID=UPI00137A13AB|nr:oxygen-dependent coproporphyrinogen oxidase [Sediminibacterium soli]NCI47335.1 oxygen-dependent coproporphyrinogen oxidase [Sediminibacterium soli]
MTETARDNTTAAFRERWIRYTMDLQDRICRGLEQEDGKALFRTDEWQRMQGQGGGGRTRVIANGNFLEKGGVNTSVVFGQVTDTMRRQLGIDGEQWFACGLSLVLHPVNPYVPTTHANWRYFELYDGNGIICDRWFGGGADLTPYYLFEEDARHFHSTLKNAMDPFGTAIYPQYKKQCDAYFANTHRNNETRGIGGVFYDHIRPGDTMDLETLFTFQRANGDCFLDSYLPIVQKRSHTAYGERETEWQEIRRGRYVEFNLIHDRGTVFGLKTGGRTESILMSLPPRARWEYDHHPEPGSEEEKLLKACQQPVDWL